MTFPHPTPLGAAVTLLLLVGSVGAGLLSIGAVARAQQAPLVERVVVLEQTQRETVARLRNVEESSVRQDTKLDLILNAWNIPNPAPAPKRDGGR